MYQLYYKKEDGIIKIEKLKKVFDNYKDGITDEITYFNDCYSFCSDRKKLKQKAEEIRNEWINEAKVLLEKYESVQIK